MLQLQKFQSKLKVYIYCIDVDKSFLSDKFGCNKKGIEYMNYIMVYKANHGQHNR